MEEFVKQFEDIELDTEIVFLVRIFNEFTGRAQTGGIKLKR